jgi:hypothetical protein
MFLDMPQARQDSNLGTMHSIFDLLQKSPYWHRQLFC